jgi:hypothetical protein
VGGSYSLTARVTDSEGISTVSAPVMITVGSTLSIQFDAGLNGSTVNDDTVLVSGTVNTPPNSGVMVNGQLATVTAEGQFFLNDLYLATGANTVTATVTTVDGKTANQVISINGNAMTAQYAVTVPTSGILDPTTPLFIDVDIAGTADSPLTVGYAISLKCDALGGGTTVTQFGTYRCGYTSPGIHVVSVTIRDAAHAVVYSVVKRVRIDTPRALYNSLVSTYGDVIDRLKSGNIDGAANVFTGTVREKYRTAFTELGAGLTATVNGFGVILGASINAKFAELVIVNTTAQGDVATPVILGLGADGIWRIDGF